MEWNLAIHQSNSKHVKLQHQGSNQATIKVNDKTYVLKLLALVIALLSLIQTTLLQSCGRSIKPDLPKLASLVVHFFLKGSLMLKQTLLYTENLYMKQTMPTIWF